MRHIAFVTFGWLTSRLTEQVSGSWWRITTRAQRRQRLIDCTRNDLTGLQFAVHENMVTSISGSTMATSPVR